MSVVVDRAIEPGLKVPPEEFVEAEPCGAHLFYKKTFMRPTYCGICTLLLWGIRKQGYCCEGR